jgi:hypothetical protein
MGFLVSGDDFPTTLGGHQHRLTIVTALFPCWLEHSDFDPSARALVHEGYAIRDFLSAFHE